MGAWPRGAGKTLGRVGCGKAWETGNWAGWRIRLRAWEKRLCWEHGPARTAGPGLGAWSRRAGPQRDSGLGADGPRWRGEEGPEAEPRAHVQGGKRGSSDENASGRGEHVRERGGSAALLGGRPRPAIFAQMTT